MRVFFKDKGETEILEITKHLRHESFVKDETVFDYGSVGDKYYLIIRGEISIMIPSK